MYAKALDYKTYRLNDRSTHYSHRVAGKISKWITRMKVQLGQKQFDPADPVSILSYLSTFKTACDSIGVHEGAAVWLFSAYMKEPAKAALTMRIESNVKKSKPSKGQLRTYSEIVNYLLKTYASDDVIAEAEEGLRHFVQAPGMTELDFATKLTLKVLRCGHVYNEAKMIGFFIEGLNESIRSSVRSYWGENPAADLSTLARKAASIAKLVGQTHRDSTPRDRPQRNRGGKVLTLDASSPATSGPTATTHTAAMTTPPPVVNDPMMAVAELLMLSQAGASTGRDTTSMDAGGFCKVCFSPDHDTSKCTFINGQDFVEARNKNFHSMMAGRRSAGSPSYGTNDNGWQKRDNNWQRNDNGWNRGRGRGDRGARFGRGQNRFNDRRGYTNRSSQTEGQSKSQVATVKPAKSEN